MEKRESFVAQFDILGFEKLVNNSELEKVANTYRQVRLGQVDGARLFNLNSSQNETLSVLNFSDTFIFYTADISNLEQNKVDEIFDMLRAACLIFFVDANCFELPIRGTIVVGDIIVSEGAVIGRPIVEAYKKEKMQDWIGCWITDECIEKISKNSLDDYLQRKMIVEYEIPLKEGDVGEKYALNWVSFVDKSHEGIKLLDEKKSKEWCVRRKHKNTKEFIDFVRKLETS